MMDGLFAGVQIIKNPYICKMQFVRWKRKHRKSRINKK